MLLLTFPDFKQETGLVADRLKAAGADPDVFDFWCDFVAQDLQFPDEDDEFNGI